MQTLTYSNGAPIQPGQWIKTLVQTAGGIWHHGIIRTVQWTGTGYAVQVVHNVKQGGVAITGLHGFADNGHFQLVSYPESEQHAEHILARADANIGRPYDVFGQNCEHFCSFCYTGTATSETLRTVGGAMLAIGVAYVALKD